jgi:hypothetical protein
MKYSNFFISLCFSLTVSTVHAAKSWTLAVSEGTSGGIDAAEALAKYEPLARLIEKATGHKDYPHRIFRTFAEPYRNCVKCFPMRV